MARDGRTDVTDMYARSFGVQVRERNTLRELTTVTAVGISVVAEWIEAAVVVIYGSDCGAVVVTRESIHGRFT